jgi:predicted ribosome quality control (RQC) complex YloA/Tae2 family protein
MREVLQIEVYEVLKGKIGEQEAKLLIEYIELKKKEVATKEDIQRLEEIVRRLEEFVKGELQRIEKSTKEDIQRLEQFVREEIRRLEKRVEKVENEIIDLKKEQRRNLYWILGVYITLWATTIGGIITILLKMKF